MMLQAQRPFTVVSFVMLASLALLVACNNPTGNEVNGDVGNVTAITLTPREPAIVVDDSAQLELNEGTLEPDDGAVHWESDDESVVTVRDGTVTGQAEGTATVMALIPDAGLMATAEVTVWRYALGDTGPAGGHVFFVDEENQYDWTYLEAAPEET